MSSQANVTSYKPLFHWKEQNDKLRFGHLTGIEGAYLFAVQVKIVANDHTGIAHLLEHIIVTKTRELLSTSVTFNDQCFITGVTYPNHVVFYVISNQYKKFEIMVDALLNAYLEIDDTEHLYNALIFDTSDEASVISELIRREKDRLSVIWQRFYHERYKDTEYAFNSGGRSDQLCKRSFEAVNSFWMQHRFNKVDVMICGNAINSALIDRVHHTFNEGCKFSGDAVYKNNLCLEPSQHYVTMYKNSYSYGIGLVNEHKNSDFIESLLYNLVRDHKGDIKYDCVYENSTPYGMLYFGLHLSQKHEVSSDMLFDLLLKVVNQLDDEVIRKKALLIKERIELINLDAMTKYLEVTARCFQKLRRRHSLTYDEMITCNYDTENGHVLKQHLIDFIMNLKSFPANHQLIACYQ